MSKIKIVGILDYVTGHLRHGHVELVMDRDKWNALTEDEQKDLLKYDADFILDDYSLEDKGDIVDISIEDI